MKRFFQSDDGWFLSMDRVRGAVELSNNCLRVMYSRDNAITDISGKNKNALDTVDICNAMTKKSLLTYFQKRLLSSAPPNEST